MDQFWALILGVTTEWDQEPTTITWKEAEKLIRKGRAKHITQHHRGRLEIIFTTTTGETYRAPQDRIDQAYYVIKEIDPTFVFTNYSTE